jgi:hypothetical protein
MAGFSRKKRGAPVPQKEGRAYKKAGLPAQDGDPAFFQVYTIGNLKKAG